MSVLRRARGAAPQFVPDTTCCYMRNKYTLQLFKMLQNMNPKRGKLSAHWNETETKQFQNCFETVLFQFHFNVWTLSVDYFDNNMRQLYRQAPGPPD